MKRICVAIALVLAAASVLAQDIQAVRKAIDRKEQEFVKAMKAKDMAWFEKSATPDLKQIDNGRTTNRADFMSQTKQVLAATKSIQKISSTITSIKMVGKSAVAITDNYFEATMMMPNNKTGKFVSHSIQQETWVLVGKDWKVKEIKGIKENSSLDGKPIHG